MIDVRCILYDGNTKLFTTFLQELIDYFIEDLFKLSDIDSETSIQSASVRGLTYLHSTDLCNSFPLSTHHSVCHVQ